MRPSRQKDDLHRLIDALPEEKIKAAKKELLGKGGDAPPERLAKRLDLLERIVDSLPDATLAVDRAGKVLVWNRALEEMTGVKREEMLGRGGYAYAVPFYGKKRPLLVNILLCNGKEWEGEYEKIERHGPVLVGEGFAPFARNGRGLHFWTLAATIADAAAAP
ncbi:MAG: PAS domain-containing protein [Desulfotomaculales bacterium]